MADFDSPYMTPMDQGYHNGMQNADRRSGSIEETIFPISLVGQTVPELDASGRNRNIIEGVDAAFRAGAGNVQLVMMGTGQMDLSMGQVPGPAGYGEVFQ